MKIRIQKIYHLTLTYLTPAEDVILFHLNVKMFQHFHNLLSRCCSGHIKTHVGTHIGYNLQVYTLTLQEECYETH